MSELTLQSNGITICYDEFGNKTAPAILLVMGLGTQMIAWTEEFCMELAAKGYRVIRFDNRDVGLSQKFDEQKPPNIVLSALCGMLNLPLKIPYTLMDMANDALGVLDALSINKAHIVGASMGGMIGQLLAANYPERVLSLTSIMSTSGLRSLPGPSIKVIKLMLAKRGGTTEEYVATSMKLWRVIGSPAYVPNEEELRERILRSYNRSFYPSGYGRQLAAINAWGDRVKELKAIKVPTLVIHGKADVLVPVEGGIDTARHIKGAKLELFDGMGHDLPRPLLSQFSQLIHENAQTA